MQLDDIGVALDHDRAAGAADRWAGLVQPVQQLALLEEAVSRELMYFAPSSPGITPAGEAPYAAARIGQREHQAAAEDVDRPALAVAGQAGLDELLRAIALLRREPREPVPLRRGEAEAEALHHLRRQPALGDVRARVLGRRALGQHAGVEAAGVRQQRLAAAGLVARPLRLRALLLVLDLDAVALGEHLDRLAEGEVVELLHEGEDVAALAAAEAVVELGHRVDGARRRALLVERAARHHPARHAPHGAGARLDQLDDVRLLAHLLLRALRDAPALGHLVGPAVGHEAVAVARAGRSGPSCRRHGPRPASAGRRPRWGRRGSSSGCAQNQVNRESTTCATRRRSDAFSARR